MAILPGEPGAYTYSLVLMQTDVRGFLLERTEVGLRFTLGAERPAVGWEKTIPLQKGAAKLRIYMRDPATGRTGSLTIPL